MYENSQIYFTTGEFARLCGVKKDTLFHYDAIGILRPDIVRENGYRYYSINQFFIFDIISMLKKAGAGTRRKNIWKNEEKSWQSPLVFFENGGKLMTREKEGRQNGQVHRQQAGRRNGPHRAYQ